MSYIGSDAEQDNKNVSDFRRQRSSSNLMAKESPKHQNMWNDKQNDDTDSEISDSANFLAKGAFLLTPSHELTMDRAALICEKMNFKGCFSLTKTATGILFKFSHPEDYQAVFKKGELRTGLCESKLWFSSLPLTRKVFIKSPVLDFTKRWVNVAEVALTLDNLRAHKNLFEIQIEIDHEQVAIPCRPQKTFTLYVFDVPEDLPEEDIRHALYKFNSVVEVVRLVVFYQKQPTVQDPNASGESDVCSKHEYST